MRKHSFRYWVAAWLMLCCAVAWATPRDEMIKAVKFNDVKTVSKLLKRGMDPNTLDDQGNPLLYLAMREKSKDVATLLINTPGIDLEKENPAKENALMIASLQGLTPLVKLMIDKGAEVNKHGWAPLHYAATNGHDDVVKLLLDNSAYIDVESPNGTTPLMMAARGGHASTVQLLLDQGADPTLKNQLGLTAADFARNDNQKDLADALTARAQQVLEARKHPPAHPAGH